MKTAILRVDVLIVRALLIGVCIKADFWQLPLIVFSSPRFGWITFCSLPVLPSSAEGLAIAFRLGWLVPVHSAVTAQGFRTTPRAWRHELWHPGPGPGPRPESKSPGPKPVLMTGRQTAEGAEVQGPPRYISAFPDVERHFMGQWHPEGAEGRFFFGICTMALLLCAKRSCEYATVLCKGPHKLGVQLVPGVHVIGHVCNLPYCRH